MKEYEDLHPSSHIADKEMLILLKKNKMHLYSKKKWEEFASGQDVPSAKTIISRYHSWKRVKTYVGIGNMADSFSRYSREELKEMLDFYKEYTTSEDDWDTIALKFSLPSSYYIVDVFGSWSNMRIELLSETSDEKELKKEKLMSRLDETMRLLRKRHPTS